MSMTELRLLQHINEDGLASIDGYERFGGYQALRKALDMNADEVLSQLEGSGLRGRGGAGFSMGKKASFIPKGTMDKYLCCNADESEPGTFKDRLLMQKNPHLLIEGIMIAAYAGGINRAFIYIRGEYELQAQILAQAIEEAKERGYIGERILGSDLTCSLVLHRGAGAYICGEETGLLDSLEGKRGNPRLKPPFPANQGLYQGPTLINNVETLMNVPAIVSNGVDWFKSVGTEKSTGTKVVSVSGSVQRPGNYEVELGIPARDIVYGLAGGPPEGVEIKCWFPGGSSAPVLMPEDLDLSYDFETMAEAGSMLGSGAIIVVGDDTPIVDLMLERIDHGEATPMDLEIMAQIQENIIGNCLCVLGDSMAMPIGSMIEKLRPEFEEHMERARMARDDPNKEIVLGAPDLASSGSSGLEAIS
jgi:NADH-quinone oxidoreductase subunit F